MSTQPMDKRKPEQPPEEARARRNKGGRPSKSPEEINSETFLLYLTPSEIDKMKKMHDLESKLRKVSLNQFIKDRFFKSPSQTKSQQPTIASEEVLNKTLITLIRIDLNLSRFIGNFNQSTKRLNSVMASSYLKEEIFKHADLLHEMGALKLEIKSIVAKLKLYFT